MSVTPPEIHRIAALARLTVSDKEIESTVQHLGNVLDLIGQMTKISTDNIDPMAHPLENQQQRLREDNITETNQRDNFQKIAPLVLEGLYIVPKVIE